MKTAILFTIFFFSFGYLAHSVEELPRYENLKELESIMPLKYYQLEELNEIPFLTQLIFSYYEKN